MTTADTLRAEGRAETLIQLLTHKFGQLTPDVLNTVRNATDAQLHDWTNRILTANTIDELLS